MSNMLTAALWYHKRGFPVVPLKAKDEPYVKWKRFQNRLPEQSEIEEWWRDRWPDAGIAIVTGKLSTLTVVDADSVEGKEAIEEYLSENFKTPICKTPRPGGGWHYYFLNVSTLRNSTAKIKPILRDCDIRSEGGYVVAPPTCFKNNGSIRTYNWMSGLKISDVAVQKMPDTLAEILEHSSAPANKSISYNARVPFICNNSFSIENPEKHQSQLATPGYNWLQILADKFPEGSRDDAIFHIAHHLFHGGMPVEEIESFLSLINDHCCNPPDEQKKAAEKIKSVVSRARTKHQNISDMVKSWILATDGYFLATDIHNELQLATKEDKRAANAALVRLKGALIEPYGKRRGCYRRIEQYEDQDWNNASTATIDIWLPFDLSEIVMVMPGSQVLFPGAMNSGKSAVLMNVAKENRHKFNVYYISSELGAGMFKRRMSKFDDTDINDMARKIHFRECHGDYQDAIVPGRGNLNIIDYIEVHDEFWKIGGILDKIYQKQNESVVVAAVQKNPGAEYGRGGAHTLEKPVLVVNLDNSVAKIIKCKEFKDDIENPRYKQCNFRILDGCKLLDAKHPPRGWYRAEDQTP